MIAVSSNFFFCETVAAFDFLLFVIVSAYNSRLVQKNAPKLFVWERFSVLIDPPVSVSPLEGSKDGVGLCVGIEGETTHRPDA